MSPKGSTNKYLFRKVACFLVFKLGGAFGDGHSLAILQAYAHSWVNSFLYHRISGHLTFKGVLTFALLCLKILILNRKQLISYFLFVWSFVSSKTFSHSQPKECGISLSEEVWLKKSLLLEQIHSVYTALATATFPPATFAPIIVENVSL